MQHVPGQGAGRGRRQGVHVSGAGPLIGLPATWDLTRCAARGGSSPPTSAACSRPSWPDACGRCCGQGGREGGAQHGAARALTAGPEHDPLSIRKQAACATAGTITGRGRPLAARLHKLGIPRALHGSMHARPAWWRRRPACCPTVSIAALSFSSTTKLMPAPRLSRTTVGPVPRHMPRAPPSVSSMRSVAAVDLRAGAWGGGWWRGWSGDEGAAAVARPGVQAVHMLKAGSVPPPARGRR